ncbi:MAG TPA: aryl-sulfate sulfotransferase, partial [Oscillatoriaceae cyanobacterium]
QIAGVPSDFPDYTVTASGTPKPGVVCMAADASDGRPSYLIVTDQVGKPQYYKRLSSPGYDLQRHTAPDGSVRYSYMQEDGPQLSGVATFLGEVHLLDGQYHELKTLSLLPYGDHGALPADLHDFVYLDDNHYILLSSEQKQVTNIPFLPGKTSTVSASIIQEVDNGQVVFDWDSTQHPEFYANSSDGNDFTDGTKPIADYMHMNSVCVDPKDDDLIVSFRHQDQIVKLDRKTGAILWRLGGRDGDFPLTPDQRFSHQHYVRVQPDGSLTLFDNGNASQHTRLLTFKLDETAHSVTSFQAIDPSRYTVAMGSYQPFDGDTYFVGWGAKTTGTTDAEEVTDGVPTFTLTFDDPAYSSYRALKYLN